MAILPRKSVAAFMHLTCHVAGVPTCLQRSLVIFYLLTGIASASAQLNVPALEIQRPTTSNGWVRLSSSFHSNALLRLEAFTNLATWQSIATLHDALFRYPDAATLDFRQRFYRLHVAARGPTNDCKNRIIFHTDYFLCTHELLS